MRARARFAWCAGMALAIAADVLPLRNFVGHAHWAKVVWIPFTAAHMSKLDVISNMLLFMPLGFLYRYPRRSAFGPDLRRILAIAALTACAGEFFQIFCHNRFPSATDAINNVLGAGVGAAVAFAAQSVSLDGPAACGRRLP